jgi:hypothetical protein
MTFGFRRSALRFARCGATALLRETIEQAVTAGGDEIRLAAAARHMRGIPGALEDGVLSAAAIMVPKHGATERAARPVVAGQVHIAGPRPTVHLRTGQNVMLVGRIADASDDRASFGQRILKTELVIVAVKIVDVLRNDHALEVLPGAGPDAIARIDGRLAVGGLRAQIGTPGFAASTCPLR